MPIETGFYFGNNKQNKSSFEKCVAEGGDVRKLVSDGNYVKICYPKDGSRSVPEEELKNKKRVWKKK